MVYWLSNIQCHIFHDELAPLVSQYIVHVILRKRVRTSCSTSDKVAISLEAVEEGFWSVGVLSHHWIRLVEGFSHGRVPSFGCIENGFGLFSKSD